jgi:uncharacterized repeat protein (TIGR03803 family)
MKKLALTLALSVVFFASEAYSQNFTTLVEFTGSGGPATGADPISSLTISGTTLYGMTSQGGASNYGNIFSVGTDGTNFHNLVSFTGGGGSANGRFPIGSLTLSGATLYGMTTEGGNGNGNIFNVGTGGTNYQNLDSLGTDGQYPVGSPTVSGTAIYGMTLEGGAGFGNIFSVGTGGTNYQNLYSFPEVFFPSGGAVIGVNGSLTLSGTTLYGVTQDGGNARYGNIFSISTSGTNYQNLVSFTGSSGTATGEGPTGTLILSGTTLYGMTNNGGADGYGNIFSVGTDGTSYQSLLSFTGSGGTASGEYPAGSLILSGTTLYGMTQNGGLDEGGNIFSVGIDGSDYQNLYNFTDGDDGALPRGDLTLSGGTLFGISLYGANADGTIFALTLPTSAPAPEPGTLTHVVFAALAFASCRLLRKVRKRYHERAGVSKKSTLESFTKPKFVPFSLETPECYTSVSTNTSGN